MTRKSWTFGTLVICLCWQLTCSSQLYSGSWCPFQEEKLVPCRVRNGTEPYYGPNICWKSVNGSYACTKKILHRPKFITTYKKIFETKYKCCPGLEGDNCQLECFNCSSFNSILDRLEKLEQFAHNTEQELSQPLNNNQEDELNELHHDYLSSKDEMLERNRALTFLGLDTRMSSLANENRALEARIRLLESEIISLKNSLEDLINRVEPFLTKPQNHPREEDTYGKLQVAINKGTSFHLNSTSHKKLPYNSNNYYSQGPTTTTTTSISSVPPSSSPPPLAPSPFQINPSSDYHQSILIPPISSSSTRKSITSTHLNHRQFEENLERGDIASTLNDDYGEELLFDNSTEQYVDPLFASS